MEGRALFSSLESAALGGALVLMGGGIGAALYKPPRRPAPPVARVSAVPVRPIELPPPPPPRAETAMTPAELRLLLGRHASDPVAARFGSEFLASPPLKKIWDEYARGGDLEGMVRTLLASAEVQELFAKYQTEPSFQVATQAILDEPRVAAAFKAAEKPAAPAPPPAVAAKPQEEAPKPAVRDPDADDADDLIGVEELAAAPKRRKAGLLTATLGLLFGAGIVAAALRRRSRLQAAASEVPAAPPEAPPAAAGLSARYETVKVLSETAAEQVVEARDPKLDRIVAIRRLSVFDASLRDRLLLAASVVNPALLSIYEVVEEGGKLCLVTERCDGKSVAAYLKERGRATAGSAARVLEALCRGLEAAHARGVAHGRLSTEQLLVTDYGAVKLLNLGMWKAPAGDEGRLADVAGLAACWREMTGSDALLAETRGPRPRLKTAAEFAARLKEAWPREKTGAF